MTATTIDPDLKVLGEEIVPINKLLGIKVASATRSTGTVVLRLPLRHDFVGNVVRGMPHDGTIAALIDAAAGAAAALSIVDLRDDT